MLQYWPHFSSGAVCLQLKSILLEQRVFAVVWHQCLPSMPWNGERANMMQHHVRQQCAAAIVFRATGVKSHDIYRRFWQFSHWDDAFVMHLCLKERFPNKNLVILSDLYSDGLCVKANTTAAPLPPADQTEMLTYQQQRPRSNTFSR